MQGGDLVLVLHNELLKRLHDGAGTSKGLGAEGCFDDLILADVVNRQFVLLLDLNEEFAEFRILKRLDRFLNQRGGYLLNLLLARCVRAELLGGSLFLPIGIDRFHETPAQVFEREASAGFTNGLSIFLRDAMSHAGQSSGDAGEHVFFCIPECHGLEQLLKGDARLLFHRPRIGLVLLADDDGIDDNEVVFACGIGRDGLQIIRLDDADATALHLLEEGAGFDHAHEDGDLDRLDVGAGNDHIHCDGDAGVVAVAKAFDEVLGSHPGDAIGDLLGEFVAFAELLANDFDDVFRVGVVLGEDEGLGHLGAAGKDLGEELLFECFDDGADLVRGDHVAVELVGIVGEVVIQLFPSLLARVTFHLLDVRTCLNLGAGCGDGGADAVHVVVDVDAVGHGLLVVVFHDQVLIEEAEGLLVGCGGEADEVSIEVFKHLCPVVVDGSVAFVGDDDVEGFNRNNRIVANGLWLFEEPIEAGDGGFLVLVRQSRPLSMEYMRWMVLMQTRAVVSRILLFKC